MPRAETAEQAARLTDPIGHGLGLIAMIGGALLGAVVAAAFIAGTVVTGGALAVAVVSIASAAVVSTGTIAAFGLGAAKLTSALHKAGILPLATTGAITSTGSQNVIIGNLPAARAVLDQAAPCAGIVIPHGPAFIAEGALTVFINRMPAARVGSKLTCGAQISKGHATVAIGGPTKTELPVADPEHTVGDVLNGAMFAASIGAVILWGPVVIVVGIGFSIVYEGAGYLNDVSPGLGDAAQGLLLIGGAVVGGRAWRKIAISRQQIPRGFLNRQQFEECMSDLRKALHKEGINDAAIGVRGSSVTGESSKGGPFRETSAGGRKASDVDVYVESEQLTSELSGSKSNPDFVHPDKIMSRFPALEEWSSNWSELLGREITPAGFRPGAVPPGPTISGGK